MRFKSLSKGLRAETAVAVLPRSGRGEAAACSASLQQPGERALDDHGGTSVGCRGPHSELVRVEPGRGLRHD